MLPPLGNTFFEATIPSSVTKIISQFGYLDKSLVWSKIKIGISHTRRLNEL